MKRWLIPCLLLGAGIVAYHNSFTGPFIFDDFGVLGNPFTAPRNSTPVAGRPVAALSFALNHALGGGYHVVNLALHLGCGLLLSGIARRSGAAAPHAIALLWLVHPLLTESVDYISQRTELLMALFCLLTLYCVIRGWTAGAIVACALGMASKEVMAATPLLVLLYDRAFLAPPLRQRWKLHAGLAATWLILAALVATGPRTATVGFNFAQLTPWQYATIQCQVILHYLRLCFVPAPLVLDYSDWPVPVNWWPALAVIVVLLGATAWAVWKRPKLGFCGAWFFLILAPTSSFLPIVTEVAAERRMYLPLAAVIALVVAAGSRWLKPAVLVVVAAGLTALTIRRNEDYRTAISIWADTVAKRPANARAHNNLGSAYEQAGRLTDALRHYAEAARLKPDYAAARNNWGAVLDKLGRPAEALPHYREAVRLDPRDASAHNNLGSALERAGNSEQAHLHFAEAVRLQPDFAAARFNLAAALERRGDWRGAAEHYTVAVRHQPDFVIARQNLGIVLAHLGRFDEATVQFAEVLRLRPDSWEAEYNWGLVLQQQNRPAEAARQDRKSTRLNSSHRT